MESRLRLIRKELKLTQEELAGTLGIGKSALSMIETGRAALSERNKRILIQELNVNPDWLDKGQGSIFNSPPKREKKAGADSNMPYQKVPLFNMEESEGLVKLLNNNENYKPVDYIYIPNLPKCEGAIYMTGDSMFPYLRTGDIILYKQVRDLNDIFWGDMYLISIDVDGEEFITVKYIQKSDKDGFVKLVSQNQAHGDKDIEKSKILALAFIKASIRVNSII